MSSYANLVAEMARRRLLRKDIATVLGVSLQTVGLKLKGRFSFSLDEAKTIHNELFKDCDFVYLFKREDPVCNDGRRKPCTQAGKHRAENGA